MVHEKINNYLKTIDRKTLEGFPTAYKKAFLVHEDNDGKVVCDYRTNYLEIGKRILELIYELKIPIVAVNELKTYGEFSVWIVKEYLKETE